MDLNVIRRLELVTTETGAAAATASMEKLADAQGRVGASAAVMATATDTAARKVTSVAGSFDRLMQRLEPVNRLQQEFERGQRTVAAAIEQGVVSTERAARATQLLEDRFNGLGDRLVLQAQQIGKAFGEDLAASFAGSGKAARDSASIFEAEFDRLDEIARFKAMQIGDTFRSTLDASFAGSGKGARDSASVFAAEFDRLDEIARFKAMQIGDTFRSMLDASFAGSGKGARDSASVFAAEFDRLDTIARQKAEQAGAVFRSAIDDNFAGSGKSAAESGSVFAAMDRDVALLRAQIDPLSVATERLNADLARYQELASVGAISTTELVSAQVLARGRFDQLSRQIDSASRFGKGFGTQMTQLSFQINDAATMALSGASAFQILATQGGQVIQVLQMGEGGVKGSLAGAAEKVASLVAPLAALPGPLKLAALAAAGAAAAVGAYELLTRQKVKSLDEVITDHAALIRDLKAAYGEAAAGLDSYTSRGFGEFQTRSRATIDELKVQQRTQAAQLVGGLAVYAGYTQGRQRETVLSEYSAYSAEITKFAAEARAGKPDVEAFIAAISTRAGTEPLNRELQATASNIIHMADGLRDVTGRKDALEQFFNDVGGSAAKLARELGKSVDALDALAKTEPTDLETATRLYREGQSTAKTPGERAALEAAYLAAQDRIAGANAPIPRAKPNLADFDPNAPFTALIDGGKQRLSDLNDEIAVLGKGSSAVEAYRMQEQMLYDLQKQVGSVTDDQRKAIDALTASYGDLLLVKQSTQIKSDLAFEGQQISRSPVEQQVATTMRGLYGDDYASHTSDAIAATIRENAALKALDENAKSSRDSLEKLQLQLMMVGRSAADQGLAAAMLEVNQQIRRLGVEGTAAAEEMRRNALLNAQTAAEVERARSLFSLSGDTAFARSQIGRSPVEQEVATSLRGIYGDDYLSHMRDFEAQQIRNNAALRAMSDAGRAANDNLEQMRERIAEIGMPAEVAARRMAGLLSDQQSRAAGISGTPQAASLRTLAVEQAGYNTVAARTLATWDEIKGTGESAIDSITGKIGEGTLSLTDFLDVARDLGKEFTKLAIANPLKNALFGDNLPTLKDAQGLIGSIFGGKGNPALDAASALTTTVGAMTVTAGSVVVSGGLGIGASDALGGAARSVGIGSDAAASRIAGLAGGFRDHLSDLISGAKDAGYDISVKSGFRSVERQAQLYDAALSKYGSEAEARRWVAPPGRSMHNFGEAADLGYGSDAAQQWAHDNAGRYGLNFPLSNENWHIEPIGARADAAGRSLKDMADAATSASKATTGLGSGLGDLSSGFANLAQRLTGSAGAAGNANWLSNVIASMTPGATGWLNANGNAFSRGSVIPFARGDVFDRPHVFPMAKGDVGMLGEAGPEAIMPLRRLANGRLGVEAGSKSGGGVNVIVNNNGSTTRAATEERTNAAGQREVIVTIDEMTAAAVQRRGGATDRALAARGVPVRTRKLS